MGSGSLASMEPAERIRMGELGRRYAQTTLSMEKLGERMERMIASAVAEFPRRA